jgi:hypothetical protein
MKTVSCLFFASEDYNLTRFDSRMGDVLDKIPFEQARFVHDNMTRRS